MAGTQTFPIVPSSGGTSFSSDYMLGVFGDGSDGDFTYVAVGPTSLNREFNYNNCTIQAGSTVKPAGFRLFCRGTFTNAGNFNDDGTAASGITGGAAFTARQYLGGASGAGTSGRSTTGAGAGGGTIAATSYNSAGTLPTGGAGGAADGGNAGGAGGVANAGSARWASSLLVGRGAVSFAGGSGGGAGGCNVGTGTASSGGGGAGGGIILVSARYIINTGTISVAGGKGGDAVFTGDGKAGGGGGGGGGHLGLITQTPAASIGGTVTAAGGAGGAGANGGAVGSAGTAGSVSYLILA